MADRNLTLALTLKDPTIESVGDLVTELRRRPGIVSAGIVEFEDREHNFEKDLEQLINRYSMESGSNTPDFLLTSFLKRCLENWNQTVKERDQWFGGSLNIAARQNNGPNPKA